MALPSPCFWGVVFMFCFFYAKLFFPQPSVLLQQESYFQGSRLRFFSFFGYAFLFEASFGAIQ